MLALQHAEGPLASFAVIAAMGPYACTLCDRSDARAPVVQVGSARRRVIDSLCIRDWEAAAVHHGADLGQLSVMRAQVAADVQTRSFKTLLRHGAEHNLHSGTALGAVMITFRPGPRRSAACA